jgi:hypothetical protein
MKAIVRGLLTVLTVVVSLGLAGVTPAVAQEDIVSCVPTVWQLTAGQTIPVGSVIVNNDGENITVTYNLSNEKAPLACFGQLHLWGGPNLADVPSNPQGTPVPGQFPYQFNATGLRTHTFTIPIADRLEPACNAALSLYIVSHAEVDLDCTPGLAEEEHETAFGGNQAGGDGDRWWFYGNYTLCCPRPVDPPVSGCTEETAWGGTTPGKGPAWWYYYDNILTDPQPIYAGQNLTNGGVTCVADEELSINLGSWSLQDRAESVKVQCYTEGQLPSTRPEAGLFTTFKGTALTVPGVSCNSDSCRYIAIHLDVQQCPAPTVP